MRLVFVRTYPGQPWLYAGRDSPARHARGAKINAGKYSNGPFRCALLRIPT